MTEVTGGAHGDQVCACCIDQAVFAATLKRPGQRVALAEVESDEQLGVEALKDREKIRVDDREIGFAICDLVEELAGIC